MAFARSSIALSSSSGIRPGSLIAAVLGELLLSFPNPKALSLAARPGEGFRAVRGLRWVRYEFGGDGASSKEGLERICTASVITLTSSTQKVA